MFDKRKDIEKLQEKFIGEKMALYKSALMQLEKAQSTIKELEEFFNGPDLVRYTKLSGEEIMLRVVKSIEEDKIGKTVEQKKVIRKKG